MSDGVSAGESAGSCSDSAGDCRKPLLLHGVYASTFEAIVQSVLMKVALPRSPILFYGQRRCSSICVKVSGCLPRLKFCTRIDPYPFVAIR